ncbi:hypothetical protein [Microbacterium sp. USTB-Y]|nr:hypothetical protein [Microbacterium sp. USTB-Y]
MSLIRYVEARPGEPLTIPATHVQYDTDGYQIRLGIGRQAQETPRP